MSNDWKTNYLRWMSFAALDPELRNLLHRIRKDEGELEDCFYKNIEFGTGGMRGIMGPGTNRINVYTIRKASEGLARYLDEQGTEAKRRGVVIAYDTRHSSREFAMEAAKVLGKHGIRVYVFNIFCPTPLLSFAVRHTRASAGIVITASHNPPEYNGFKVYGADGAQITLHVAEQLLKKMDEVENELTVGYEQEETLIDRGLLASLGKEILDVYLQQVEQLRFPRSLVGHDPNISIVFTPLHGTTLAPVTKGLALFGYDQVSIVNEQANPDPNFSTVDSPNPEEEESFRMAIHCAQSHRADLVMGTDPDGDRLGVVVPGADGNYTVLTGNQVGVLLLDYLLAQKKQLGTLPPNGVIVKTIVTSELGRALAAHYGVETVDTLTGFKYIGEKISEFEKASSHAFLFGYEESCGYLIGDFVRDKDAIQIALLMADVCAFHKSQKKSLYEALHGIYARYGYYREELLSFTFRGQKGIRDMEALLALIRAQPWAKVGDKKVAAVEDYLLGVRIDANTGIRSPLALPASDVIKIILEGDHWFCLRPSGTEPKMKLYIGVREASASDAERSLIDIRTELIRFIQANQR